MSVSGQEVDNLVLQPSSSSGPIPIDRARFAKKSSVVGDMQTPLVKVAASFSMGEMRSAAVGGMGSVAVNAVGSSFVGVNSSFAHARRSPIVHPAPQQTEQPGESRAGKLKIMPRKFPPVDLVPVPTEEGFQWAKGVRLALTIEAVAGIGIYGIWQLWHLVR